MFDLPKQITLVNADHIRAMNVKYESLLAQVYAMRQSIGAMESIAREAMMGIISSNPHPAISSIIAEPKADDEVTIMLNYKFWNALLSEVRDIVSVGVYCSVRDVVCSDELMKSKPTIEALNQWFERVNRITLLSAEYFHHMKTFEGREGRAFEILEFKLKSGSPDEKIDFLLDYLDTATQLMHELSADRYGPTISIITDAEIESINEMVGRAGAIDIGNSTISLKFFANGNIDLKQRVAFGLKKFA